MSDTLTRLVILALVGTALWLLVTLGRRVVEARRQQALTAPLLTPDHQLASQPIRILAFSSADCRQCHQLQAPALRRVVEARGQAVEVVEIDATTEHDLTRTYHVMTVPSTVVLDTTGKAQAVNYGFTNTQRLLTQIDTILTQASNTLATIAPGPGDPTHRSPA